MTKREQCRCIPDFKKPQTHEFRQRNKDGTWKEEWWTCSAVMAELLKDEVDVQVRERT